MLDPIESTFGIAAASLLQMPFLLPNQQHRKHWWNGGHLICDQCVACVDVQIINKQEPRKVEMLSEEERMEKQVESIGFISLCAAGSLFNC